MAQNIKKEQAYALVLSGIDKHQNLDFYGAISDYTKALGLDPENYQAFANRGITKYHLEQYNGALRDCNSAIEVNPKGAEAYNYRGLVYAALDKLDLALRDYSKAIKIEGSSAQSFYFFANRGLAYLRSNELKKAVEDFNASIQLNEDNLIAYQNRGSTYYRLGQLDDAIADFSQAVAMSPNNKAIFFNLGICYLDKRNFDQASSAFKKMIEIDPSDYKAYENLAVCYDEMGDRDRACGALKNANELGSKTASYKLGQLECEQGTSQVQIDRNIVLRDNVLETDKRTEKELMNYFTSNLSKLDPIEGIWIANKEVIRDKKKVEDKQSYGRVAVVKDSIPGRHYKMIFLNGKGYFPGNVVTNFSRTAVKHIFSSTVFDVSGLSDQRTFSLEEPLLSSNKNSVEGSTSVRTTLYYLREYPTSSDVARAKPVKKKKSTGSGFFIGESGLIATNEHVIRGADRITVSVENQENKSVKVFDAKMIIEDAGNDVAVIKIDDPAFAAFSSLPYKLERKHYVGESALALGFPEITRMGAELKAMNGIISSKSGPKGDPKYMQTSIPLRPGNSGGPVFNKDGNIIGIAAAKLVGVDVISYVIKISYLNILLDNVDQYEPAEKEGDLIGMDLSDQIATLRKYTVLITSYPEGYQEQ